MNHILILLQIDNSKESGVKRQKLRREETSQSLTNCTALGEDPNYVPTICIRWLSITHTSSSRRSGDLLASVDKCTHICAGVHRCACGHTQTFGEVGEGAWWLRTLAILPGTQVQLSAPTWQLTTVYNF